MYSVLASGLGSTPFAICPVSSASICLSFNELPVWGGVMVMSWLNVPREIVWSVPGWPSTPVRWV